MSSSVSESCSEETRTEVALFCTTSQDGVDEFAELGGYARELGMRTNSVVKYNPLPGFTCASDVYHPSFGFIIARVFIIFSSFFFLFFIV